MLKRAQAGLEYLMTYGWALVLIVTIVGALLFVVSAPTGELTVSSSDPSKIMVKSSVLSGGQVEVILQNVTGGSMSIGSVALGGSYSGCKLNGRDFNSSNGQAFIFSPPVVITSGSQIIFEDITYSGSGRGSIQLDYTDYAGLERRTILTGSVAHDATGLEDPSCGDGSCNGNENCSSCEADCGACAPVCGDGNCNDSEDCGSCEADCGACGAVCGNDLVEIGEVCDGTDLNSQSCATLDFNAGTLSCFYDCSDFNTIGCSTCGNSVVEELEVCDSTFTDQCPALAGFYTTYYVEDGATCSGGFACHTTCSECITLNTCFGGGPVSP